MSKAFLWTVYSSLTFQCLHLYLILLLKCFIRSVSKTCYLKNGLIYSMMNSVSNKDPHSLLSFIKPQTTLLTVVPHGCSSVCSTGHNHRHAGFQPCIIEMSSRVRLFCPEILNHLTSFFPRIYLSPSER